MMTHTQFAFTEPFLSFSSETEHCDNRRTFTTITWTHQSVNDNVCGPSGTCFFSPCCGR